MPNQTNEEFYSIGNNKEYHRILSLKKKGVCVDDEIDPYKTKLWHGKYAKEMRDRIKECLKRGWF